MRKLAFMQMESLTRFVIAFLLTSGVALPLLLALDLGAYLPIALALSLVVLVLLTVLNATPKMRKFMWIGIGGFAIVQFFLPHLGMFGSWFEAIKALSLYFSNYTVALPMFGNQVASLIGVYVALLSYAFAKRGVGFLPAALVVVLVMFGLWSLGKGNLFWYVAPALVALLLQMSQAAHEKINLLNVLPMALVAVLVTFLLLPVGRVTVEPLAKAAGDLKQAISDYLFFNEPRNPFKLGSYGYYPQGSSKFGGPVEPSEYPVMIVKTNQRVLMRGVTKDLYTGTSFADTSSNKRYLYVNPRYQALRRKVFMENLPSEAIRKASALLDEKAISVQMQNAATTTILTPLYLRSVNMAGDMVPYFSESSELFITRDLASKDQYTVYTPIIEGGQNGLEALVDASLKDDRDYQEILSIYSQLPGHLEQKVYNDVENIVKGETTPYGKAMAIMRHLQKYYRYTLTPDTPPENLDFVTYFLYVGKEGYCTYYAAAMTVMARMAGLPSRYVEGFLAEPGADGFAYITGKEAHAWTEVYFEGFGWVPFDPTPSQNNQSDKQADNNNDPEPSPSPSPEDQPTPSPDPNQPEESPPPEDQPSEEPDENPDDPNMESTDDENDPPDNNLWWIWLLVAAAIGGLTVRIVLRSPDRVAAGMPTEQDKVYVYGASVQRLLAYAKRTPKQGETPVAFAKRVDGVHVFPTPILPLWRILALSNYSRMETTAHHTERARDTFQQVFKGSHPLRKLRFLLAAAFDPRFYRSLETPAPKDEPPKRTAIIVPKPPDGSKGKAAKTEAKPKQQLGKAKLTDAKRKKRLPKAAKPDAKGATKAGSSPAPAKRTAGNRPPATPKQADPSQHRRTGRRREP